MSTTSAGVNLSERSRLIANGCYRLFGSIFLGLAVVFACVAMIRVLTGSTTHDGPEYVEDATPEFDEPVADSDVTRLNYTALMDSMDVESKARAFNSEIDRLRDRGAFSAALAEDAKKNRTMFDRRFDKYSDATEAESTTPYFNRGVTLS